MKEKFYKYPSIEQFRHVVRSVQHQTRYVGVGEDGKPEYDPSKKLPKLSFMVQEKLHGTNSGVVITKEGDVYAQSRTRVITPEKDNYGFAQFVEDNKEYFLNESLFELSAANKMLAEPFELKGLVVFGEFCGNGIQKNVAVSEIEKSFFIFDIGYIINKGEEDEIDFWDRSQLNESLYKDESRRIFDVLDLLQEKIVIDFDKPEVAQNKLVEAMLKIEEESMVSKVFGTENKIGEGIVIKHYSPEYGRLIAKIKGEKHVSSDKFVVSIIQENVKLNGKDVSNDLANFLMSVFGSGEHIFRIL